MEKKKIILSVSIDFMTTSDSLSEYTKYDNTIEDTIIIMAGIKKREQVSRMASGRYFLENVNICKI